MTDRLTKSQISLFKEVFSLFDKNGNGSIMKEELDSVLKSLGIISTKQELDDFINDVDEDGNGIIELDEFLNMMRKRMTAEKKKNITRELFNKIDRNGNGVIGHQEIYDTMLNLGEKLTHDEVTEMFQEADINQDGKIDYEDFVKLVNKIKKLEKKSTFYNVNSEIKSKSNKTNKSNKTTSDKSTGSKERRDPVSNMKIPKVKDEVKNPNTCQI
ncbi:calmodulin-alpha-like [Centruroides sculpturatus]|uniref:calmodulin-alpha-like n=1 Tax=Centruroides sculpturatus TaxID=218467 RepID=UPI000C6E99FF|nr:calmodulin-alpha-like [Centruroides sculpturatus]